MAPMIAESPSLENGECSLVFETPKYKRRRVSAVRDFPPGCGPNAPRVDSIGDGAACCSGNVKDTEQSVCDVERKKENDEHGAADSCNVETKKTSCDAEHHASLSGVTRYVLTGGEIELVKEENAGDEVKHADGGLVDLSKNLGSDHTPGGTVMRSCSLSKPLQVHAEYVTKKYLRETQELTKDLMGVELEVPSDVPSSAEGLKVKETIDILVTKGKMAAIGNSTPNNPSPSTVLQKERHYPPRRKVSAVRDFPAGCGTNQPSNDNCLPVDALDDHKQMTEDTTGCENNEADVWTTIKEITDHINVEAQRESDKDDFGETSMQLMVVQPPESPKCQLRMDKIQSNEGEKNEQLKPVCSRKTDIGTSEARDGKDVIVYRKDNGERKRATVYPGSNSALQIENMDHSDHEEGLVVVHALMAAANCPWQQGQRAVKGTSSSVKGTSSSVGAKGKRRKKCVVDSRHKLKSAVNEAMEDAEEQNEESMDKTGPSLQKSGEMVIWDGRNSPEDAKHQKHLPLAGKSRAFDVNPPPFGASCSSDRGARNKVRETLRLFQVVLRKLLQEQETKSKEERNGRGNGRIDLKAAKILKSKGKYINTGAAMIGLVPGVEVGDEFHYRVELMMIGLHRQSQAGIDYVKVGKMVLATSIVASGGYDNDVVNSDVLTFSGQGGNVVGGDKEPEDQKLERGNLALKNSIDEKNVVRVIRGVKEAAKPSESSEGRPKVSTTYTYDGLYTVDRYWQDIGQHGKKVYKFELKRLPDQPELAWNEVKKSKKIKDRDGRCVDDISDGKEPFPVCAVNTIDDEKPPPFKYITRMIYPDWCNPIPSQGCGCTNGCSDSSRCGCVMKNGGEIPYTYDGAIVEAKSLVFECGPSCKCPPSCHNRVSQLGLRFQLEIFKTKSRGWGVRSLSSIPSGSFICEYIGELLEDREAELRSGSDEYLFDIGQNYNDHSLWEGLSGLIDDGPSSSSEVVTAVGFTIDAVENGNLGRFINHACSPNLYAQNVLYDHEDRRIPHIMFFAAENIPPLQELTYHYNYAIGEVTDKDGNEKVKNCYCGSSDCTGRMY